MFMPYKPKLYSYFRGLPALLISWLVLTIAFGIDAILLGDIHYLIWISIAVATGFIFHELAHREVARRLGCAADYIMWPIGLALALFLALLTKGRFVFAAPGAVTIFYCIRPSRSNEGIIAAAGPITNMVIAFISQVLYGLTGIMGLALVAYVNWFLAAFNLLPLDPLDGAKVMRYNFTVWLILFIISAYFAFAV